MFVRSATGGEAPGPGQPLPAPARWHLRTQVSRKTLFDLIQDTLPAGGPPGAGLPGDGAPVGVEETDRGAHAAPSPFMGSGGLPQVYLDPNAATVPISLNPATLWNDGDTSPDLPEHWRPITITLASATLTPPAPLPSPPRAAVPRHPLHGVVKSAGWMLTGMALTFLVSAAAFGGAPLIRAVRSVMARPQAQAATIVAAPAATPPSSASSSPGRAVHPSEEPDSRQRLAAAPGAAKVRPVSLAVPRAASAEAEPASAGASSTTSTPAVPEGDRRAAGRGSRRTRPERRAGRPPAPAADSLLSEDAVMPLESAPLGQAAPTRPASTAMVKAAPPRAFRPIDVEDPFGGR